ncbi:MAG: pilus assembly protein [Anaerolineales bacterium]|nr:pilus assembly protein [Anaerolineales bacterium]
MMNALKKIISSLRAKKKKLRAQSLVEFAVLLPILLILFSGMVEFGFVLNAYLSLLDATRQTARLYSTANPFELETDGDGNITKVDNPDFYLPVAENVIDTLDANSYQIQVDSTKDDILVSVVGIDTLNTPGTIKVIRHPYPTADSYYTRFNNGNISKYTDAGIVDLMTEDGNPAINTGVLIVEIYYSYEGTLKLPWVAMFASDASPMMLYASSIMPMGPVAPSITPTP